MTGTLVSDSRLRSDDRARTRVDGSGERKVAHGWIRPSLIASVGLLGLFVALLAALPLVGWGVVRLASGSMSPGLPTNSLLLVRQVDASTVHVGDVVTVKRTDELPITHRVIAVTPGIAPGEPATIKLKGDANDSADPAPYTVSNVDLVVVGVPWGGQILTAVRSPIVLALLSVAVSLLVLWAWWPRRREGDDGPAHLVRRE